MKVICGRLVNPKTSSVKEEGFERILRSIQTGYFFCARIFFPAFDVDTILIFRPSSGHVCRSSRCRTTCRHRTQRKITTRDYRANLNGSDLSFQRLSTDLTASSWNPKELNASVSLDSACPPSAENRYLRRMSLMTGRPIRLSVQPPELQRQRSCDPVHPVSHNLLNTIKE